MIIKLFEDYIKGKWVFLTSNPDKIKQSKTLIDLVNRAYKHTEYGSFIKNTKDVIKSDWLVINLSYDGINGCIFYRGPRKYENWIGKKIQGIGHDGNTETKSIIIRKLTELLREKGIWIESSGKMDEVLLKNKCKIIKDVKILKKLFPKSNIKMIFNGEYERDLDPNRLVIERVFGNPVFKK